MRELKEHFKIMCMGCGQDLAQIACTTGDGEIKEHTCTYKSLLCPKCGREGIWSKRFSGVNNIMPPSEEYEIEEVDTWVETESSVTGKPLNDPLIRCVFRVYRNTRKS